MRHIAFFSDIHGNLTALEAVLADIRKRGITESYFLGDILGRGPAVHELIALVRENCRNAVYGNWDTGILNTSTPDDPVYRFSRSHMSQEEHDWLLSLPETIEMDIDGLSVIAYHGRNSVRRIYLPAFASDTADLNAALDCFGPHDITIVGDAHHSYSVMARGRWLLNTGAVGTPTDGLPRASYLILHLEDSGDFSAEHVRVRYNITQEVSRALRTPDLPFLSDYITEITTATYCRKARDAYYKGL